MKQGTEDFDLVKNPNEDKENYIFQKNKKTKVAFFIVAIVLALLVFAVATTAFF